MKSSWALLLVAASSAAAQTRSTLALLSEDEGAIAGQVCADLDDDGRCGPDEPGVAGVRVLLETGQAVWTDARGRYHFAAVPARGQQLGRHRLKVDVREGAVGSEWLAATVEVTRGALVQRDFPLVGLPPELTLPPPVRAVDLPPEGLIAPDGTVRFLVTGRGAPEDRVSVAGQPLVVGADGSFQAWVPLHLGANDVALTVVASHGAVQLCRQHFEVVERDNGVLVIPAPIEVLATLELPRRAITGRSSFRLRAPPGTRVALSTGEVPVGGDGEGSVVLDLATGTNLLEVRVKAPEGTSLGYRLELVARADSIASALLDLELSLDLASGKTLLQGRGAAHGERQVGTFTLEGELDLRGQDVADVRAGQGASLLAPRRPERLERALDPDRYPTEWGDRSLGVVSNAPEGRLRFEVREPTLGKAGLGTQRATLGDSEVGRYQREVFGPYLEAKAPAASPVAVTAKVFGANALADPTHPLGLAPAHEELRATGGSLFYLGHAELSEGSEVVRIEVRDGPTGLPLSERHLARGRDYELDARAGRLLLREPLSFFEGVSLAQTGGSGQRPTPVLVIDYEYRALATEARPLVGGKVEAAWRSARLQLGVVNEGGREGYGLYRGVLRAPLGPLRLTAEAALSRGVAIASGNLGVSEDGGLTFSRPLRAGGPGGLAHGVRLQGAGLFGRGSLDVSWRWREAGFSDGAHLDAVPYRQLSARVEQPLGDQVVRLLADDRLGGDPRAPYEVHRFESRRWLGSIGRRFGRFQLELEAQDTQVTAEPRLGGEGDAVHGGRSAVGLAARLQLTDRWALVVGHRQCVATRGLGLGALDDTFSSAGVEVRASREAKVSLRGGYGPTLGPQLSGHAEVRSEKETWYGGYGLDVDGPLYGERRSVTGARTDAPGGGSVFAEDVAAHDANALRLSRAVGLSQPLGAGVLLGARFEQGAVQAFDLSPALARQAGGLTGSAAFSRGRVFARLEVRRDKGTRQVGSPRQVDLWQRVVGVGGELELLSSLRFSGRLNASDTTAQGEVVARLLEGSAGLSLRLSPVTAVLRYSIERERRVFDRSWQVVSLMPSVSLGSRLSVASGLHWGFEGQRGAGVGAASLRPSVAVSQGLEVAAEVARRTWAPEGESLWSTRGELGYRLTEGVLFALGYTVLGYSGLGISRDERAQRLYLRAELAY